MDLVAFKAGMRWIAEHVTPSTTGYTEAQLRQLAADVRAGSVVAPATAADAAELLADHDVFEAARELQCEGMLNDYEVTRRDLFSAARGTGYGGEALGARLDRLVELASITDASRRSAVKSARRIEAVFERSVWIDAAGHTHAFKDRQELLDTVRRLRDLGRLTEESRVDGGVTYAIR